MLSKMSRPLSKHKLVKNSKAAAGKASKTETHTLSARTVTQHVLFTRQDGLEVDQLNFWSSFYFIFNNEKLKKKSLPTQAAMQYQLQQIAALKKKIPT